MIEYKKTTEKEWSRWSAEAEERLGISEGTLQTMVLDPEQGANIVRLIKESMGYDVRYKWNYTGIKTYEDACKELEVTPVDDDLWLSMGSRRSLALHKLEVISEALWGCKWWPNVVGNPNERAFEVLFSIDSQYIDMGINYILRHGKVREMKPKTEESYGKYSFAMTGTMETTVGRSWANARLLQPTMGQAEYFGRQFFDLWVDYLAFEFDVKKE